MKTIAITLLSYLAIIALHAEEPVSKLKPDEEAVLFPALGWRNPSGEGWLVEFHGWAFEREPRRASLAVLQKLIGLKIEELSKEERAYFDERARWFLVDNERGKRLQVNFAGETYDLGKTEANGHASRLVAILEADSRRLNLQPGTNVVSLNLPAEDGRQFLGTAQLVGEEGWTVISDIDDTIKITEVRNRTNLVRNTFCRAFEPAAGMAAMYAQWAKEGAVFHYVSASPWQLYPDLETFRAAHGYPQGSIHLRHFRFKDRSGVEFLKGSGQFKPDEIGRLIDRFPRRKFILVGDSGEHDPEIYGELARQHPGKVVRILIRDVTGDAAESERYRAAFQDVAREKWAIFKDPREVGGLGPAASPQTAP